VYVYVDVIPKMFELGHVYEVRVRVRVRRLKIRSSHEKCFV